jgi:Flp pilus assembly protein TadD
VFDDALARHPHDATLLNNLGGFHLTRGDRERAERLFRRSLAASPGFPSAVANLDALEKSRPKEERPKDEL